MFTPGPWIITKPSKVGTRTIRDKYGNPGFVKVLDFHGKGKANARLIAEAPAMYRMIERLARNGGCTCEDLGEGYICDVCEAKGILARIEGANENA